MKSCVLYCYKETEVAKPNLEYFLQHGIVDDVQYVFIVNDCMSCSVAFPPSAKVFQRFENERDMPSFKWAIQQLGNEFFKFDSVFLLNSSCRGPFLPVYESRSWIDLLSTMLGKYDVVGPIVEFPSNIMPGETENNPFLHSYMIGYNASAFSAFCSLLAGETFVTVEHSILFERKIGKVMFQQFKVKSLLTSFQSIDLREKSQWEKLRPSAQTDVEVPNNYFGIDVHPYEIMFVKTARPASAVRTQADSGISAPLVKTIDLYTRWSSTPSISELRTKECKKLAVIVTCYLTNAMQQQMFLHCIRSILKFYQTETVVIVNDNPACDVKHLLANNLLLLNNVIIENALAPQTGECNAWLWSMQNSHNYDNFIYIHDSVVLQKRIPDLQRSIQPLWYAPEKYCNIDMNCKEVKDLVELLQIGTWNGKVLFDALCSNKVNVLFGTMARWDASFAEFLKTQTNLAEVFPLCNTKLLRCATERIMMFALHAKEQDISSAQIPDICFCGDIHKHGNAFTNKNYEDFKIANNEFALKAWHGR